MDKLFSLIYDLGCRFNINVIVDEDQYILEDYKDLNCYDRQYIRVEIFECLNDNKIAINSICIDNTDLIIKL